MIAVITTAERRRYRAGAASTLTKQNDTNMFTKLQYDTKFPLNYHFAIFFLDIWHHVSYDYTTKKHGKQGRNLFIKPRDERG